MSRIYFRWKKGRKSSTKKKMDSKTLVKMDDARKWLIA